MFIFILFLNGRLISVIRFPVSMGITLLGVGPGLGARLKGIILLKPGLTVE
jgi:hypothetical protein